MTVQEIKKKPAGCHISGITDYGRQFRRAYAFQPPEEEFLYPVETYYSLGQIDSDGIQTDHPEEQGPFPESPHIGQIIEKGKPQKRPTLNINNLNLYVRPAVTIAVVAAVFVP